MTSNSGAALVKKTHPIRGFLWGILFGLGLAIVLVVTGVIPLDLSQMAIVLVLGVALGVLWSLFGPAKPPRGPAPAPAAVEESGQDPEATIDDAGGTALEDTTSENEPDTSVDEN
jgi:hypothetical protein